MNIQGLFQFMSSEQGNSFFCDVTPENSADFLDQLMQNSEFTTLAREYVDDVSVLRQKVEIKIGQMCKKMKKAKDEPIPLPVKTPKLVDECELINVQYAIDDRLAYEQSSEAERDDAENIVEASDASYQIEKSDEDVVNNIAEEEIFIDESLGTHLGSNIYLQREGHVIKMMTPQFTVYY